MFSRAINGFTQAQVDAILKGELGTVEFRTRHEIVDEDNIKIRDIETVIKKDSSVTHSAAGDVNIKRRAVYSIVERDIEIDPISTLIIASNPLFYLDLGETSGNFNDTSGNGRTFTANGTITYGVASLFAGDENNPAITLNGTTGYLSAADAAWMDVTAISLQLGWKATSNNRALIDRDDGSSNRFFRLIVDSSGKVALTLTFTTGAPATTTFTANAKVNDGNPHIITATYNGSHVIIYIDSLRVLKTAETRTLATGTLAINIGRTNAGTLFNNGTFDKVAMWNRALTQQEIRNFYQSGFADYKQIDYNRDRIKSYYAVKMPVRGDDDSFWVETSVGVFAFTSPLSRLEETDIITTVQAFDLSWILRNDKVTSTRYTIASGIEYIAAVATVAQSSGFDTSTWSLQPTNPTKTLPAAREWKIGTTKLEIINDLLTAVNYRRFRFDNNGNGVAEPNILPENRSIEFTLITDENSIISPGLESDLNLDEIPNEVVLSTTVPDRATLISAKAENLKISSPTSKPRRNNRIVPFTDIVDAVDQTTLNNLAIRVLAEKSQAFRNLVFKISKVPFFDDMDCISVIVSDLDLNEKVIVMEFVLPFLETEKMDVKAQSAVSVL